MERTKTPEQLERQRQYVKEINQELEYDRLYKEAPNMIKALTEFRNLVKEFRETGKLDYGKMSIAADNAELVIARADRRRYTRTQL